MFENFLSLYEIFKDNGHEESLEETLKIFNILSNGQLKSDDTSILKHSQKTLEEIVKRRLSGMPTEYALGLGTFYGRTFYTESGALITREETELLVDKALSVIKDRHSDSERLIIVDMGTGSGSIAISIALNTIGTEFYASDINADTVRIAKKNIHKFNLEDRITLLCGDKFEPYGGMGLEGHVDFVICNPPYIPSTSLKKMDSEIIDYEPKEAFIGGSFRIEFFSGLIEGDRKSVV
jgi:release factor glutamine methyltransferase